MLANASLTKDLQLAAVKGRIGVCFHMKCKVICSISSRRGLVLLFLKNAVYHSLRRALFQTKLQQYMQVFKILCLY